MSRKKLKPKKRSPVVSQIEPQSCNSLRSSLGRMTCCSNCWGVIVEGSTKAVFNPSVKAAASGSSGFQTMSPESETKGKGNIHAQSIQHVTKTSVRQDVRELETRIEADRNRQRHEGALQGVGVVRDLIDQG